MSVALELERSAETGTGACAFCESMRLDLEPTVIENDHFVAWASVGALAEGHLLVVPRLHALNCAELEYSTLHDFMVEAKRLLEHHYGEIALFEHGPAKAGTAVGCSIDHAHVHLLPWNSSLVAAARGSQPHLVWAQHRDLRGAFERVRDHDYLLVVDPDGKVGTAVGDTIGSQVMRQVVAREQGRPEEWNWKTHPRVETQRRTLSTIQPR